MSTEALPPPPEGRIWCQNVCGDDREVPEQGAIPPGGFAHLPREQAEGMQAGAGHIPWRIWKPTTTESESPEPAPTESAEPTQPEPPTTEATEPAAEEASSTRTGRTRRE